MNGQTYSKQQIEVAMEQLVALVKWQTGLPEEKIIWTPGSMLSDLTAMLEGKFDGELAEMNKPRKPLF